MTTEPYVPNEQELIEGSFASEDEARRGIAKIKADARIAAWKEVAEFMRAQASDDVTVLRTAHLAATTIYYRVSQIEQEEA